MKNQQIEATEFLNVDLNLIGGGMEISGLLNAFGQRIVVLHSREGFASVELVEQPETIEDAIVRFGQVIRALPPRAQVLWKKCTRRIMSIGIKAGERPHSAEFEIPLHVLAVLSEIRADVELTIYASKEQTRRKRTASAPRQRR